MGKPARVVEQLPHRHASLDQADLTIERERTFVDELEDDRGDEELGRAGDPKTMLQSHRRSGREIGDARGSLPRRVRAGSYGDHARNAGSYDCLQVIVERAHG